MIGWKYHPHNQTFFLIGFLPQSDDLDKKFQLQEGTVIRDKEKDFFKFTKNGEDTYLGYFHKRNLFISKRAAIAELKKLLKADYQDDLNRINEL